MSNDHWLHEEDAQTTKDEAERRDTFWTLQPKPVSDREFVEQLRKSSETVRRWRWLAVVFIALLFVGVWEMRKVFQGPGLIAPGGMAFSLEELLLYVSISGVFGLSLGFKIGHWLQMAAEMFWGDRRTDLLIRYHDILDAHNLLNLTTSTQHTSDKQAKHNT